jgi:hypothetical protein
VIKIIAGYFTFSLASLKGIQTIITARRPNRLMRKAIVTLFLGLAVCLGFVGYQHYSSSLLYERQNEAIALIRKQQEASRRENQALKERRQLQERSRVAFSQAQPIAARYRKLFKVQNTISAR